MFLLTANGTATPVQVTGPITLFATGDSVFAGAKAEVLICDTNTLADFAATEIVFTNDSAFYLPTTGTFFLTVRVTGATAATNIEIRDIA